MDAAEKRLIADGPGAVRLQDVAADVGMTHPTLLHHVGSREEMMRAVVTRALQSLDARTLVAMANGPSSVPEVLDAAASVLGEQGHARLLAWIILSHDDVPVESTSKLSEIAEMLHTMRLAAGAKDTRLEDAQFTVMLVALVMFAAGFAAPPFLRAVGLPPTADAGVRFRTWFAERLLRL